MHSARYWIRKLNLRRHPEGGWYREIYRAAEAIPARALPRRFRGSRAFATSIYYLLERGEFSAFHRIRSDEIWHAYEGAPVRLHMIAPDGRRRTATLGRGPARGEAPQVVVPAGHWFAAEPAGRGAFALTGCTVAPGFDMADFELAERAVLSRAYPRLSRVIHRLTRG